MKVKYTELAAASGKLGGTVHARNKAGNYVRQWANPTNPQTSLQMAVRAILTTLSRAWGELSDAQRAGWQGLADGIKRSNSVGSLVSLSGNALFNEFNGNLQKVGVSVKSDAPAFEDVATVTVGLGGLAADSFDIALSAIPTGDKILIKVSPQLSAGVTNAKNKMRVLSVVTGTAAPVTYDALAEYTAKFGVPVEGKKIFVSAQVVNVNYAISSAPVLESQIVATAP